MNLRDKTRR